MSTFRKPAVRGLLAVCIFAVASFFWARRPAAPPPETLDGGFQTWRDLAADLPFAERYDSPYISLTGADAAQVRYFDHRWATIDPRAGGPRSFGSAASVFVPGLPASAEIEVDVEVDWSPGSDAKVAHLETPLARLGTFEAMGRTTARVSWPASDQTEGYNILQLNAPGSRTFRLYGARVQPVELSERAGRGYPAGSYAEGRRIWQMPRARLAFSMRPPTNARLRVRVPAGPERRVIYERSGEPPLVLATVPAGRTAELNVALPGPGAVGRLVFVVRRSRVGSGLGAWERPQVVIPSVPETSETPQPRKVLPPNVVLYVMDAMRADHLEPYGYSRATSPRISEFARSGILFERAFAHSVWTKTSMASVLTGLRPGEHAVLSDAAVLSADIPLLAQRLRALGYSTLGYQTNNNAAFTPGFDLFEDQASLLGAQVHVPNGRSSAIIQRRIEASAARLREPFFLFVQAVDSHYPYDPPEGYQNFVSEQPRDARSMSERFRDWAPRQGSFDDPDTRYFIDLYDGAVRHEDASFGRLLDFLKARGVLDRTAIVLTADHGEGFKDHGYEVGHGSFFQHTVWVPLILKLSANAHPGTRSDVPVQHIDIVPTILGLAGSPDATLPGRSLLESLDQSRAADPRTVAMMYHRDRVLARFKSDGRAVVSWPYKLILHDAWRPDFALYDLARDETERHNNWPGAAAFDPTVAFLWSEMLRYPLEPSRPVVTQALPRESLEALRALGYID